MRHRRDRLRAILGEGDLVPLPAKRLAQHDPVRLDIVRDQHAQRRRRSLDRWDSLRSSRLVTSLERDLEPEPAAFAGRALHPDLATHGLDQPLADRQPEAGAAINAGDRALDLAERNEQLGLLVRRYADPGVVHLEADAGAIGAVLALRNAHPDAAAWRELHRV